MRPRLGKSLLAAVTGVLIACSAMAQPAWEDTDTELRRLGLDAILASRLEVRFDATIDDEDARLLAAEDLATVYARLLSADPSPIPVEEIRSRAQRLLDAVPGEATVGLRLTLAVARYASIEIDAERYRFGLLAPDQLPRAQQELAMLRQEFASTAKDLDKRVETLDRRRRGAARRGRDVDTGPLDEAIGHRSLSSYYAAWSAYYLASLTGDSSFASVAIEDFGRLLDSPEQTPTLDRLPKAMLRYDPVARSALGVAMSYALLDQSDLALTWIRTLRESQTFPEHLDSELDTRTVQILLAAGRWTELHTVLDRLEDKANLSIAEWKLCANEALIILESRTLNQNRSEAAKRVAQASLHYLITEGQLAVVLDIAQAHPNLPLDGSGFAIKYVKGVETYENARRAHEARGEELSEPTTNPQIATLYRAAARQLEAALQSADAPTFDREQVSCAHLAGQALFAAGDLSEAAKLLETAYELAKSPVDAESPLWLAIAVLDRLAEGSKPAATKRNKLAEIYLARYADTERAGLLLLRLVGEDLVDPRKAIQILSEISPEATYANAANQYRASLIYTQWRDAEPSEKPRLAALFLPLTAALIETDSSLLRNGGEEDPSRIKRRLILTVRRALDVAISSTPPSLAHAEQSLSRINSLADEGLIEIKPTEPELTYRKLQIAMLSDDLYAADEQLDRLRILTGSFADAAERLIYTDALDRRDARPKDPSVLRRVVVTGEYVLAQFERNTKSSSGVRATVMNEIAQSAIAIWSATQETEMRDIALRLDRKAFETDIAAKPAMRRLANLAEQVLDNDLAAQAWLRLMATSRPPDPEWFAARANSIRLLAITDPERALAAIEQHRVLYPTLGPEYEADMIRHAAIELGHPLEPKAPSEPDA